MTTKNEKLYEKAMDAITDLFSDISVTQSETLENLRTLQGEIEDLCTILQNELTNSEEAEWEQE